MSADKRRRQLRLCQYDYTEPGPYFVTLCTFNRSLSFGRVVEGTMHLNASGKVVEEEWRRTGTLRPYVFLDTFVVMPNHFHAVVLLAHDQGTMPRAPTKEGFQKPVAGSLFTIIRAFKAAVSRRLNLEANAPPNPLWQRGYYEHIIRNDSDLRRIRDYIESNPLRWELDRENPHQKGKDNFDLWLASFKKRPNL